MPLTRALLFFVALVAGTTSFAPVALADAAGDKALAKQAYDRGLEAHKRGDHHREAEEFARADTLAPSAVALSAALDAAVEADSAVLGAELVERSRREAAPAPALASSIAAARTKFHGRAGRVRVACPGTSCSARLDDAPIDAGKVVWTTPGKHAVAILSDGELQTIPVEVAPDGLSVVAPEPKATHAPPATPSASPPPAAAPEPAKKDPPPKREAEGHGLPPVVFVAGVVVTLALGGATTYFALDTQSKHETFADAGCESANFASCERLKRDGESGQEATNIGIAATSVAGALTAVLGIAFTNWKGPFFGFGSKGQASLSWRTAF